MTEINEDEEQLFTRYRIEGTIDRHVVVQIRFILEKEREKDRVRDRKQCSLSEVLEMLLRKGIRVWMSEQKVGQE